VKATGARPKIVVAADGKGVVGHAGARLLADLAEATGLTDRFSQALAALRRRDSGHDPGRVAVDLAVMLADGGEAIADLAVLRGQSELFGSVASDATAWRVLDGVDQEALVRLRAARAAAREVAWAQRYDLRGGLPMSMAADRPVAGLVLDVDASIVVCHSEKQQADKTWKKTFGFHPIFCFLDNTREALAGLLRTGSAGSNTTTDHIAVLDEALAQLPDGHRYGNPILVRADTAGGTYGFLAHIRGLRQLGMNTCFSVGVAITEPIRAAITATGQQGWCPALDTDGDVRDGAEIAEITALVDRQLLANYPAGTRVIARRERPHPGAQLDLFDTINGMRHQVFATDTQTGSLQHLEVRHRAHARVEDRIRCGKNTGLGRFPSRMFAINTVWLELALTAIDLLAWTQLLLLDGELATVEPKRLRYRLLHVAARITHGARRTRLRIAASWPWASELVNAFTRLAALPRPAT
jgi:Transposase DDE domain group 1